MSVKEKIKNELKLWVYYVAVEIAKDHNTQLTYEDINSVVIDILSENNKHDPKELFKQR
jgi:hypothetical protein